MHRNGGQRKLGIDNYGSEINKCMNSVKIIFFCFFFGLVLNADWKRHESGRTFAKFSQFRNNYTFENNCYGMKLIGWRFMKSINGINGNESYDHRISVKCAFCKRKQWQQQKPTKCNQEQQNKNQNQNNKTANRIKVALH